MPPVPFLATTLTPFGVWRKTHNMHHATSGNLDRRGLGDIETMTVAEYNAAPWYERLRYRVRSHLVADRDDDEQLGRDRLAQRTGDDRGSPRPAARGEHRYTPEEYGPKKTWGHSTYDYVVQIAAAAGVRRVALTHHDPSHNDHFVADIERKARTLALQRGTGLEIGRAHV